MLKQSLDLELLWTNIVDNSPAIIVQVPELLDLLLEVTAHFVCLNAYLCRVTHQQIDDSLACLLTILQVVYLLKIGRFGSWCSAARSRIC